MTVHLSTSLENELRRLAETRGCNVQAIIDEAVRQYLDALAITDLGPADIAATQMSLLTEVGKTTPWSDDEESSPDETR